MHTVSGELRKAPFVKPNVGQDGASKLFIVELSEVMKDYQTGEKVYTNYKASLFAKGGQIDYYNSVLVEGNFIVVNAEKLKVEVSDCGQYTKLSMENARLGNAGYVAQGQSQGAQNTQGNAPQQGNAQGNYQKPQGNSKWQYQQQGNQNQAPQGGYAPQQDGNNQYNPSQSQGVEFPDDMPF